MNAQKRALGFFPRYRSLSIRQKLVLIIVAVSALSLLVSGILDGVVHWRAQRSDLMKRLDITAEVISLQSTAALAFLDPSAARENLMTLRPDPAIRRACLYDEQGHVFATYVAAVGDLPATGCPASQEVGSLYHFTTLEVFHPIIADGRRLGTIYLECDLSEMYLRFVQESLIKLLIMCLVLALVWPLSSYLQRIISEPIVDLAAITRRFSKERDQPIYATKLGDDEIGELVDAYNTMMQDIRSHEERLRDAITQLRSAKETAEAANRAKGEFLANMSHEIRTPLNAVIGLTNILAMTQPLTPRQKEYLQTLQVSGDSLLSLINDLLDFAKLEEGSVQLEQVDFNIVELAQKVVSIMSLRAQERGLQILFDASGLTYTNYVGDPLRIQQVLTNLVSNAIKFTESGYVKIALLDCEPRKESLICLEVSDSGIGIEKEKLATIFDKFTQADASTSRRYGGTGLGLAICKFLVDYMHGRIEVDSRPGEGSLFRVMLPLPRSGKAAGAILAKPVATSPAVAAPVSNKTILLVEDHPANVLVATALLQEFGYRCDVATTGAEAITKFQSHPYGLILMDIQLSGMDGIETARRIRSFEQAKGQERTPIIAMTAFALAGDKEKCLKAGMDDYLAKPFQPDELKRKINTWLEDKEPA